MVETGDWTPLVPKTSPWQRLMVGRRLRPWNIYALGALYLALSALVLDLLLSQVRIIRNSLQRVAGDLGLSFVEDASQYATDWLRKRSAFSILTAVANQTTKDEAEDDCRALAEHRAWPAAKAKPERGLGGEQIVYGLPPRRPLEFLFRARQAGLRSLRVRGCFWDLLRQAAGGHLRRGANPDRAFGVPWCLDEYVTPLPATQGRM